jgi:hypothetical protein
MKKKLNEDQELIRAILGKDKFLMLNLKLVQLIGLNEAVILTYVLDKMEYNLKWNKDVLSTGIVIYRKDIENRFKLSDYQQRKVEKNLVEEGLLTINTIFDGINTYNNYNINLEELFNKLSLIETDLPPLKTKPTPLKNLTLTIPITI